MAMDVVRRGGAAQLDVPDHARRDRDPGHVRRHRPPRGVLAPRGEVALHAPRAHHDGGLVHLGGLHPPLHQGHHVPRGARHLGVHHPDRPDPRQRHRQGPVRREARPQGRARHHLCRVGRQRRPRVPVPLYRAQPHAALEPRARHWPVDRALGRHDVAVPDLHVVRDRRRHRVPRGQDAQVLPRAPARRPRVVPRVRRRPRPVHARRRRHPRQRRHPRVLRRGQLAHLARFLPHREARARGHVPGRCVPPSPSLALEPLFLRSADG